jgi:STE24 endopeptidase
MSTIRVRDLLLGGVATALAGYAAWQTYRAWNELHEPSPTVEKDAAQYGRVRRQIAVTTIAQTLAGGAVFAYGPIADRLDDASSTVPVWMRPALLGVYTSAIDTITGLPGGYLDDFVLERRYGLSEQTADAWLIDNLKGAGLSTGLLAALALAFGAVVRKAPKTWPLIAGAATLPLLVLGNIVVPVYIMPLFNAFEPLEGPLEVRLRALAARYGVRDADILRMDMSKQTKKANAFVTGIGSTHRIVIGDTLLDNFTDDEIEFVVAHELGHYVAKDTWRMIALGQAVALTTFAFANTMLPPQRRDDDRPITIARLMLWIQVASQVLRPALFAFSRSREWAADRFALEATGAPAAGAAAFRRLRDQNLAEDEQPAWYEFLFGSHPPLRARIEALERAAEPT